LSSILLILVKKYLNLDKIKRPDQGEIPRAGNGLNCNDGRLSAGTLMLQYVFLALQDSFQASAISTVQTTGFAIS
jgi:hypothetical protein